MDFSNLPLEQISSAVTAFFQGPYGPMTMWGLFMVALLNCFFGYPLRKVWCTLLGVLIGGAIGAGGAVYFHQSLQITLIAGAVCAFFGGTTAFALYRVGLFALCGGLTFFGLSFFFPAASRETLLFYLIAGIAVGILSNIYEHIVIILVTSFGGGIGAVQIYSLINSQPQALAWAAGILISLLGFLFQLKPWKAKGYWSDRRSRDRAADDASRSRRRRKRKDRPSAADRISSIFGRKKKTKKTVRTVYETEAPRQAASQNPGYDGYRNASADGDSHYSQMPEDDGYDAYDAYGTREGNAYNAYDAYDNAEDDAYDMEDNAAGDDAYNVYDYAEDDTYNAYDAAEEDAYNTYDAAGEDAYDTYDAAGEDAYDTYDAAGEDAYDTYDAAEEDSDFDMEDMDSDDSGFDFYDTDQDFDAMKGGPRQSKRPKNPPVR